MKPSTLILITSRFPYESVTGPVFISPELPHLSRMFERVIIMPMVDDGPLRPINLPNVEVDNTLIRHQLLRRKWTRGSLILNRHSLGAILRGSFDDLTYTLSARAVCVALRQRLKELGLSPDDTLLYSYWFESQADGAVMTGFPTIIRGHGHDVWTSRGTPLRRHTVAKAAALYAASDAAAEHFKSQFPLSTDHIFTAPLGSLKRHPDTIAKGHNSRDGRLTFITVARAVEGKRPTLTYEFMKKLAIARPGTQVKWIFVGDGEAISPLREAICNDTDSGRTPANLTLDLRGALDNSMVHDIYANETIDWHILLTVSEGGRPISLCESLSYGVPVAATEVGGVPELIDDDCGMLLPPDPQSEEFVRGIAPYLDSDFRTDMLRRGAMERWREVADAEKYAREFANRISSTDYRP
ncbi:MAG: glycosyltransferase [Bacteroidales bacterium]|nr:glycosyltransferase [Bacteroidales bacterium]